jgi:uncharacterized protein YecE (DUF72 family)
VIRIGTAGWSIPRQFAPEFGSGESGLQRYATRFAAVEINSTFHRSHKPDTFARWAAAVPPGFRFAVKVPKHITHELRLSGAAEPLRAFLSAIHPLGRQMGPLLVQLPPSLAFDAEVSSAFLALLRGQFTGDVVLEPRHPSWFAAAADALLGRNKVSRAAADPARVPEAGFPGGWPNLAYFRLHGSPAMYRSAYEPQYLDRLALALASSAAAETWCIFDNTMLGAATGNALQLQWSVKSC